MNKTININLAGFVMHVDEDAYGRLKDYLESVKTFLAQSDGADEIMRDVEARMVEIFQQRMGTDRQVVLLEDVNEAIAILGQPEDYRVDDEPGASSSYTSEADFRPKKRIFRNPDDKVIGGVAGGLAAYLGIDPVWIRLLLAILFFTGSGFLIYIILWIVMPEARTTAQKLQMRGEPVNLSSIEKSIRDELRKAGRSMNKAANDLRDLSLSERLTKFVQDAVDLLVNLFTLLFKAIFKIIGGILVAIGVFFIITLTIGLFWGDIHVNGATYTTGDGLELFREFIGNSSVYYAALVGLVLVTVIPSLFLMALAVRFLFNLPKLNPLVFRSTAGLVFIGIVMIVFSSVLLAKDYHKQGKVENVVMVEHPGNHHRMMVMDLPTGEETMDIMLNDRRKRWIIGDEISHFGMVEFDVEKTNSDAAFIELRTSARGRSESDARFHAKAIHYSIEQSDSILRFPLFYSITENERFRFQNISVTLKLPVGHTVYLDEGFDGVMDYLGNVNHLYTHEMLGHTWMMTEKGLRCTDCPDEPSADASASEVWEELEDIPEHQE